MREQGVVKAWFMQRGFGFIARSGGGRDAFAHHTDLIDVPWLVEAGVVEFEVREEPKGPHAVRVQVVSE